MVYFFATRPAFLLVTFVACLIGLATSLQSHLHLHPIRAVLTILLALTAHAGANVLNDYYDSRNGSDAINVNRIYPFTGGSRFIQNKILTETQTFGLAVSLFMITIIGGLILAWMTTVHLIGLMVGWVYSAPPIQLMSRGVGELGIAVAWLIVVVGSDFVQRQVISPMPFVVGLSYGLMVTNILFINQFPDAEADAKVGKRTLATMIGMRNGYVGYSLIAGMAYIVPFFAIVCRVIPLSSFFVFAALPLNIMALISFKDCASRHVSIILAIKLTIISTLLYGCLLAIGLVVSRNF